MATESDCSRRDFLRGSLAFSACCKLPDLPPSGVHIEPGLVRIDLNHVPELRRVGAALKLASADRKLSLIVAHPEKGRYVATSQKCTHGGGHLTYVHKRRLIHCTCWGHAQFALNGRVLYWPRPHEGGKPLPVYPVEVAGSTLTIRVEGLA